MWKSNYLWQIIHCKLKTWKTGVCTADSQVKGKLSELICNTITLVIKKEKKLLQRSPFIAAAHPCYPQLPFSCSVPLSFFPRLTFPGEADNRSIFNHSNQRRAQVNTRRRAALEKRREQNETFTDQRLIAMTPSVLVNWRKGDETDDPYRNRQGVGLKASKTTAVHWAPRGNCLVIFPSTGGKHLSLMSLSVLPTTCLYIIFCAKCKLMS